jgi:hypothetical protein
MVALIAIAAIVTIIGGPFVILGVTTSRRAERQQRQPLVLAHQAGPRRRDWQYAVFLTNESDIPALNVRFGVDLDGTEYAVGGGRGHRYLVAPNSELPEGDGVVLGVAAETAPFVIGKPGVDGRAVFWARYANQAGELFESRNPADPLKDSSMRRVGAGYVQRHEGRQERRRERDRKSANRRFLEDIDEAYGRARISRRRRFVRAHSRR